MRLETTPTQPNPRRILQPSCVRDELSLLRLLWAYYTPPKQPSACLVLGPPTRVGHGRPLDTRLTKTSDKFIPHIHPTSWGENRAGCWRTWHITTCPAQHPHITLLPLIHPAPKNNPSRQFQSTPLLTPTSPARHPQLNDDNKSAAERGQAAADPKIHLPAGPAVEAIVASPLAIATSSGAEDSIDADWEKIDSEPSVPLAPSTSDGTAGLARASVPASASASAAAATSTAGTLTPTSLFSLHQLTTSNINLHNMMNNGCSIHERIWNRHRGHSTVVSAFARNSDLTSLELGEPFGPFSVDAASSMFGIGAWADIARPPLSYL
ncbi:hypothetical protein EDB80DRAFT_26740 [Ilyonectria destructans]|nr:hypothetical protein EDB80DRAFT_26740 [Ilyonectria destructans]